MDWRANSKNCCNERAAISPPLNTGQKLCSVSGVGCDWCCMRDNQQLRQDKQLQGIALESVLEKRRLDQALNAKEFAVCAGVSYSTARSWFHLSGFPAFRGVIFWQDFVQWRTNQNGLGHQPESLPHRNGVQTAAVSSLPPRAARILIEAR
jgi:hypothetical protein